MKALSVEFKQGSVFVCGNRQDVEDFDRLMDSYVPTLYKRLECSMRDTIYARTYRANKKEAVDVEEESV